MPALSVIMCAMMDKEHKEWLNSNISLLAEEMSLTDGQIALILEIERTQVRYIRNRLGIDANNKAF